MHYLSLALFAEGPTDHRFLCPLLQRLCLDLCLTRCRTPVEVGEVLELHSPPALRPREIRISEAAKQSANAWRILFVHTDGESNPTTVRAERIDPALQRLRTELPENRSGVGIVPVRETEAWLMADGNALRQAFGTSLSDERLGVTKPPRRVEQLTDPKLAFASAFAATSPNSTRKRLGATAFLNVLGECISLAILRQIPAFQTLEAELTDVLARQGILQ